MKNREGKLGLKELETVKRVDLNKIEQSKAGQGRAGEGTAGQGRAGHGRAALTSFAAMSPMSLT